jgi:hypothetical protein
VLWKVKTNLTSPTTQKLRGVPECLQRSYIVLMTLYQTLALSTYGRVEKERGQRDLHWGRRSQCGHHMRANVEEGTEQLLAS